MAVVVAASLGVSNNASAATQTFPCGNGQTYTVVDGVVTTTSGNCSGSLVIDSSVTSIANWVFFNMPITSVTIPDSVTDIGIHAFHVSGQFHTVAISLQFQLVTKFRQLSIRLFTTLALLLFLSQKV